MSTIRVLVTHVSEVRPHKMADALDLATVGGWQMCVKRGSYKDGDLVVYFEQGTVLPADVAERFGVKNYLSEKTDIEGNKVLVVHRVKLRGEPSFGLVVAPEPGMEVGQDVAAHYGAVKYRPPVKATAGDAEVDDPRFPAYTDVENMRSYPSVLVEGEEVVATEKIDGTNCRVGFVREQGPHGDVMTLMAGSRTLRRRQPPGDWRASTYWAPLLCPGVRPLLDALFAGGTQAAVLYGEVYGRGIQAYQYGEPAPRFRAFDLLYDGKFVDYDVFAKLCEVVGVELAPLAYRGPFSLAKIRELSEGPSLVGGSQGREGVVVRPVKERTDPAVGRVVLKYVGDAYLFGKGAAEDTTDQ